MAALAIGAVQTYGQTFTFDFSDNTSDGWANTGFGNTPQAAIAQPTFANNYIYIAHVGFQSGNVSSSDQLGGGTYDQDPYTPTAISDAFNAAMYAAVNNPTTSYLSYDYYIDTSAWTAAGTYFQIGAFINPESGFYGQDGAEVQLNGTQVASGGVFYGHVSVPFSVFGTDANAATEVGFRLGIIENGDGTGIDAYLSNIQITGTPEPATLALCGMGLLGGLLALRRRRS